MGKTVEKSEAILALLDSFRCILNGKPEQLLYLMFVFSNLMKSSVVYAAIWFMHVCKI